MPLETLSKALDTIKKINFEEISVEDALKLFVGGALKSRVSDIHIVPGKLKYRMGAKLQEVTDIPENFYRDLLFVIKNSSGLNTNEHLRGQHSSMVLNIENEQVDLKVSSVPAPNGEECVLRIINADSRRFNLENLGLEKDDLEKVKKACKKKSGIILISGQGKTTTAYVILKYLKSLDIDIITIEKSVLYSILGVKQNETKDYAKELKVVLQQPPDAVFIDGIDKNIVDLVEKAVTEGCLVVATILSKSAENAVDKLSKMGMSSFFVSKAVNLVIWQKLVVKKCPNCEGRGCIRCGNTGFAGRAGVFEVFNDIIKI